MEILFVFLGIQWIDILEAAATNHDSERGATGGVPMDQALTCRQGKWYVPPALGSFHLDPSKMKYFSDIHH